MSLRLITLFCLLIFLPASYLAAQKKKKKVPAKRQSELMQLSEQEIAISKLELRTRMFAFLLDFGDLVQEGADSILYATQDPEIRENTLRWKMYSIPAMRRVILVEDPMAALIDGAAFCFQMRNFFKDGNGRDLFGEHQAIAVQVSEELISKLKLIALGLSEDRNIDDGVAQVEAFADDYPIESLYFHRTSPIGIIIEYIFTQNLGFHGIALDINEQVRDLATRINIYTETLPLQLRWQSELLVRELATSPELWNTVDSVTHFSISRLDTLTHQLNRLIAVAEQAPDLVEGVSDKALDKISMERALVLQAITAERIAVLKAIQGERMAVMEAVSREREIAIAELHESIDSLRKNAVDHSFKELNTMVERIYWRTIAIIVITYVVTVFLIYAFRKWT